MPVDNAVYERIGIGIGVFVNEWEMKRQVYRNQGCQTYVEIRLL